MKKEALERFKERHDKKPDKEKIQLKESLKEAIILLDESKIPRKIQEERMNMNRHKIYDIKTTVFDKKEDTGLTLDSNG